MTTAALDRRLRKLEAVLPDDDPRRYLGQPADLWPDAALERLASMSAAEYAELLEVHTSTPGHWRHRRLISND